MIDGGVEINAGHILTIVLVAAGYLVAGLLAWGALSSEVRQMKESRKELVTTSDLRAAVAEMKTEFYRALGAEREKWNGVDRRISRSGDAWNDDERDRN